MALYRGYDIVAGASDSDLSWLSDDISSLNGKVSNIDSKIDSLSTMMDIRNGSPTTLDYGATETFVFTNSQTTVVSTDTMPYDARVYMNTAGSNTMSSMNLTIDGQPISRQACQAGLSSVYVDVPYGVSFYYKTYDGANNNPLTIIPFRYGRKMDSIDPTKRFTAKLSAIFGATAALSDYIEAIEATSEIYGTMSAVVPGNLPWDGKRDSWLNNISQYQEGIVVKSVTYYSRHADIIVKIKAKEMMTISFATLDTNDDNHTRVFQYSVSPDPGQPVKAVVTAGYQILVPKNNYLTINAAWGTKNNIYVNPSQGYMTPNQLLQKLIISISPFSIATI